MLDVLGEGVSLFGGGGVVVGHMRSSRSRDSVRAGGSFRASLRSGWATENERGTTGGGGAKDGADTECDRRTSKSVASGRVSKVCWKKIGTPAKSVKIGIVSAGGKGGGGDGTRDDVLERLVAQNGKCTECLLLPRRRLYDPSLDEDVELCNSMEW